MNGDYTSDLPEILMQFLLNRTYTFRWGSYLNLLTIWRDLSTTEICKNDYHKTSYKSVNK